VSGAREVRRASAQAPPGLRLTAPWPAPSTGWLA